MHVWKVLLIAVLACVCLALAMATIIVGLDKEGTQRWLWIGGLLMATLGAGALLALFLRHAGGSLDMKPGWTRR